MNALEFIERLDCARATGEHRWIARCPAHDDRRPSLGVSELPDGRILIHCFAGCDSGDILTSINLDFSDLFPNRLSHSIESAHRPFDALQVINCVLHEVLVVSVVTEDLIQGLSLDAQRHARLQLAVKRLMAAIMSMGELPPSEELRRIRRQEFTV